MLLKAFHSEQDDTQLNAAGNVTVLCIYDAFCILKFFVHGLEVLLRYSDRIHKRTVALRYQFKDRRNSGSVAIEI